jgi:presenilin-like A22 family membrane protease
MDTKSVAFFAIIVAIFLLVVFGDKIQKMYHKLDAWFPLTTLRDWLLVLLGAIFGYGVYAMMIGNWVGLIAAIVLFLALLAGIAIIDKKREQKQNEMIREAVQEGVKEGIKAGIKEVIEELRRDGRV